jgi:hypothetical protein
MAAGIKTTQTDVSVEAFLDMIADPGRREDARAVRAMMARVTGKPAAMWGPSIVGFGSYHYRYDSGHEGTMCRLGFSPRKAELVLYVLTGARGQDALLGRLGRHRTGKSCLYIKRLGDVDEGVLEELIVHALAYMNGKYPEGA